MNHNYFARPETKLYMYKIVEKKNVGYGIKKFDEKFPTIMWTTLYKS